VRITTWMFLLFPMLSFAAPCGNLPKADMKISDVQIAVSNNGNLLTLVWPTDTPPQTCCIVSWIDPAKVGITTPTTWGGIFGAHNMNGYDSMSLSDFILSVSENPPGAELLATDSVAQGRCDSIAARVYGPHYSVVKNSARTDGARPMKVLKDPSQPLSTTNTLINLMVNGVQAYVAAGTPCEPLPVINTTTAGLWLYATNATGDRGIVLCK